MIFVLSISVICFSAVLCNQRPKDASARLLKQHIEARAARMARLSVTSSAEIMEGSCSCEHVSRFSDGAMENAISFSDLALNTAATVNSIFFQMSCIALSCLWLHMPVVTASTTNALSGDAFVTSEPGPGLLSMLSWLTVMEWIDAKGWNATNLSALLKRSHYSDTTIVHGAWCSSRTWGALCAFLCTVPSATAKHRNKVKQREYQHSAVRGMTRCISSGFIVLTRFLMISTYSRLHSLSSISNDGWC